MSSVISLGDYKIFIETGFTKLSDFIRRKKYSKIFILTDENSKQHCLPLILKGVRSLSKAKIIEIQSGERHKNIETTQKIWLKLLEHNADRKCLLINLGGGVIGDLGGWAATTYKRGIDFIQIPTTLLAQVDASIGGKLGIDMWEFKNLIGAFHNPKAVFIFPELLNTLLKKEIKSGFAEIIKHGLIADAKYLDKILKTKISAKTNWEKLIIPSLKIKKSIVEKDPEEKNSRKVLNFGHTIGHAVESLSLKKDTIPLSHGEAIAIGMICELYLSHEHSNFSKSEMKGIVKYLFSIYGKYALSENYFPQLIQLMQNDKKNENGKINFSLLKDIGYPVIHQEIAPREIIASLQFYCRAD